ncbi:MAG: FAD-binding oxidoreductase [Gemmatimonadota bacterium]
MSHSSIPWWGAAPTLAEAELPVSADFVLVGGGIVGLATAYWLARAGARPLLLEREGVGAGATGRNGGFLPIGTAEDYDALVSRIGRERARDLLHLTIANRRTADELLGSEEIDCDLRACGHLHLALDDGEQRVNRGLAALLTEDGCATEVLNREEAQALVATPFGPRIVGGLLFRDIALLHSGKLVRGLAAAALRRGATLARGTVRALSGSAQGARVVTDRGTVDSSAVLLAVNAWTGALLPALRPLITPVRGQVLAFAPIAPVFRTGMTALTTVTEEYWQQTADGSIILGGCRAVRPDRDEQALDISPTDDVQGALEAVLPGLFPAIGPLRVTHRWAGTMAFTRDRLPIVARLPDASGWAVGGFSGNGMSLGFIFGRILADQLLGGAADPKLSIFSPDRLIGAPT